MVAKENTIALFLLFKFIYWSKSMTKYYLCKLVDRRAVELTLLWRAHYLFKFWCLGKADYSGFQLGEFLWFSLIFHGFYFFRLSRWETHWVHPGILNRLVIRYLNTEIKILSRASGQLSSHIQSLLTYFTRRISFLSRLLCLVGSIWRFVQVQHFNKKPRNTKRVR